MKILYLSIQYEFTTFELLMRKDEHLQAVLDYFDSKHNIEIVPFFQFLSELLHSQLINQDEFEFGKRHLLTYNGNRTLIDYKSNFLDAIPILYEALQEQVINVSSYHDSVYQTLSMNNDKFLAQLLKAKLITYKDYIKPGKSRIVEIIKYDDLPAFGSSTPVRTAIMLNEKYGFSTNMSSINSRSQTIIMVKGSKRFTLTQKKGLFETKRTICDEYNKTYTYPELLKKLSTDHGKI